MNRRSRKGCIDCKRAKVKYDEVRPSCGTYRRRGYVCQGYVTTPNPQSSLKVEARNEPSRRRSEHAAKTPYNGFHRRASMNIHGASGSDSHRETSQKRSNIPDSTTATLGTVTAPEAPPVANEDRGIIGQSAQLYRELPFIPAGTIPTADELVLELYFKRHPIDQVISLEFVDEMNSNVLKVFHEDPAAVSDTLSAIGHVYSIEKEKSLIPILDRRARILSRLRVKRDLEQILIMLLGLCALDMIDNTVGPGETTLPVLLANTSVIINHHHSAGKEFSSVAKYFIRALARQDMMIAMAYSRPPLIPTEVWLDEHCQHHPDRFMGYTGTLMPVLAKLSILAGDARALSKQTAEVGAEFRQDLEPNDIHIATVRKNQSNGILSQRALELRTAIHQWRPNYPPSTSFQSSKNMMLHAHAYKAATLLYLHRIMEPAGVSEEADHLALSMAHEVLMHLSGLSDQLKTALWPTFIASCELASMEDRTTAIRIFEEIFRMRKTVTTLRTKAFCITRVWQARDSGSNWNWMDLVYEYPGECLPI